MAQPITRKSEENKDNEELHQYYLSILNCVPSIIYWVDNDCQLKGCNSQFVKFLGLKSMHDFTGTPYEQMIKFAHWTKERVEQFRLDDMKAIFTAEASHDSKEAPVYDKKGNAIYFSCNRVPLLDKNKKVTDLVVILTEITESKKTGFQVAKDSKEFSLKRSKTKPNILMVEDNVIAQKVECALLTELNCEVDVSETGDKAIELFKPGKYDLVLMDISLEDTSGYIVAKKLREKERETQFHVPIIALTSYQADVVKYDVHDYFMDGVLSKPITSEQVKQIIQRFIYHEDEVEVTGLKLVEGDQGK